MADSLTADIDRVCELSKNGHFDYVIVGSGLAGGILARQLTSKEKKVLLIEKGGLKFSTHCLNTSRLKWQRNGTQGPSQDNDVVYNAVKSKVNTTADSDPYVGGPVYCLGGRSNVWGLFCPKIPTPTLTKYFPENVRLYLINGGYKKAFEMMTNKSQDFSNIYPNGVNIKEQGIVQTDLDGAIKDFYNQASDSPTATLAPIAAQFTSTGTYHFPQGAYSTVDHLLDQLYSRDAYLTVLLDTEVLSCEGTQSPYSLTVRSATNQQLHQIESNSVILCAGTIGTASIALNSGLQKEIPKVGKGLTDHEIWGVRIAWNNENVGKDPMKFQSEIAIDKKPALLNVAVNANTFLSRDFAALPTQSLDSSGNANKGQSSTSSKNTDVVNITLEFDSPLSEGNEVLNLPTSDPVIRVIRTTASELEQKRMQILGEDIRNKLLTYSRDDGPRFALAGFGVVAHEVGTMRMQGPSTSEDYVVDENLQICGRANLYACDLSVFPVSPAANPSLTLAALAIRLAKYLTAAKAE